MEEIAKNINNTTGFRLQFLSFSWRYSKLVFQSLAFSCVTPIRSAGSLGGAAGRDHLQLKVLSREGALSGLQREVGESVVRTN